eukprot:GHVU01091393.1.p1 GENE.GHVU01091393.1~~GHVU01091393.1.p1  ORF type:complete len:301 (+),score=38.96 GHVU01091393.1:1251-2153(+)
MSEIALFEGTLPAHLLAGVDDDTTALAGSGGAMRRLSIKGGVFREMIGGKEYRVSEERAMNVAVVRVAPMNSRQFYPGAYVEGEKVAPTCWSTDGTKPDVDVKDRQATNCLTCPQNIKGSGQGESRACRFQRRMAVVIEGEIERREVYQLICPATSVFGDGERDKMPLQKYAQHLKSHRFPITGVVTAIRFDTAQTQPKLVFKAVRPLTAAEHAVVMELRESPEALAAITLNAAQAEGIVAPAEELFEAPAVPAVPAVLAAPAKKAAPVEDAKIEEPKKAASKKSVPEPKLADLVGEWDD